MWIDSGYDHDIACAIARRRIVRRREDPGEFGSVLLVLMFTSVILQIATLFFGFGGILEQKIRQSWRQRRATVKYISGWLADVNSVQRLKESGLSWWGHLVCAPAQVTIGRKAYGVIITDSWGAEWGNAG